ncbi:MAG: flagellar assembly protein FliH [Treponema sp.]|nr:flagellar assembly protein FliH [Treponema sp.]
MAKAVFRPGEVSSNGPVILLDPPTAFEELAHLAPVEEAPVEPLVIEEYTGPTADDLRREAEAFKAQWLIERERLIKTAKEEAEKSVGRIRDEADQDIQRKIREAEAVKQAAEEDAKKIIAEAGEKIRRLEEESRADREAARKEAEDQGRIAGKEEGFAEGKAEVERLIQRTQVMLERAQDKRGEILVETEQEIIDLVLLIARKVIKVISENQRTIVLQNVVQALRKVKTRGNVTIRVNLADLKLTTEHIKDFIQRMEGVKSIQVVEDTSVDSGGCVIETDFGEIDARISSQLAELEAKILQISPIKSRLKPASSGDLAADLVSRPSEGV